MAVSGAFGALAQGLATGIADRKRSDERKAEAEKADARLDQQIEIARINAEAARASANRPIIMGGGQALGYGTGGPALGARPGSTSAMGAAPGFTSTDDERMLLAKTIQAEAGNEGYDGMLAVGAVIGNRARSGKYGGSTLRDVIMAPGQFSAWNSVTGYAGGKGGLNMGRIAPSESALRVADEILAGSYSDPTGGATHYYNPAIATPKWGQKSGGQWQAIGNHIFGFADGRAGAHPKAAKRAALRAEFKGYSAAPDKDVDRAVEHFEKTRGAVPVRALGVRAI